MLRFILLDNLIIHLDKHSRQNIFDLKKYTFTLLRTHNKKLHMNNVLINDTIIFHYMLEMQTFYIDLIFIFITCYLQYYLHLIIMKAPLLVYYFLF